MEELISIVIPVYNAEMYIDQCIESVLNQTYANIEVIIVNDGSKDSSLRHCEQYRKDNRIKIINNSNHGLAYSRQTGFDAASGVYVCSIDADDYMDPDMINKLHSEIVETNADICVCGRIDIYKEKNVPMPIVKEPEILRLTKSEIVSSFRSISAKTFCSDTWNKLYKRDFVIESGVKFTVPKQFKGTDVQFNECLLLHAPNVRLIAECLYYHRMDNPSMIRARGKDLQGSFEYSIKSIDSEARKLNITEETFYNELSCLYYAYLYAATFDKAMECTTYRETNKEIDYIRIRHKEFVESYPFIANYKVRSNDNKRFINSINNKNHYMLAMRLSLIRAYRAIKKKVNLTGCFS